MNNERIKLRGHHFSTFAYWYLGVNDAIIYGFSKEELFDKDLSISREDMEIKYGKSVIDHIESIYTLLKTKPNLEVEIVQGLDSICLKGCPRFEPYCEEDVLEDPFVLEEYGLEVGKVYTSKEIISRISEFSKNHDFKTPTPMHLFDRLQKNL